MKEQNKLRFEFPLCERCAAERKTKLEIFLLRRSRKREPSPCVICQQLTKMTVTGLADSDKEIMLIKRKLQ